MNKLAVVAVVLAGSSIVGGAQSAQRAAPGEELPVELKVPSTTRGSFDLNDDAKMPPEVDNGAQGGPVDVFAFTLRLPTDTHYMLECESCLPRLVLQGTDGTILKRSHGSTRAEFRVPLKPGSYEISAASFAGRGGAYQLAISAGLELSPTLPTFVAIATRQKGTKTIKTEVLLRIGWDTITLQDSYSDEIVKTFKADEILSINSATTHGTDVAGALLLGAAFSSQDNQWVTIRTSAESVALDVGAKQYSLVVSELERITRKK